MWMAENHHGSESKCISRRNDHAGNEWTASQSAAKKNRTHGQQQQQQQQQQQREQQPAPVIDLRVAHAMATQSNAQPLRLRMRWEQKGGGNRATSRDLARILVQYTPLLAFFGGLKF